jgi:phosphatidylserine decarboxylase
MSRQAQRRILLYDRSSGRVIEEQVFKPRFMDFCYGTPAGRAFTDLFLKRKWFARYYGFLQRRSASKQQIHAFISRYAVNVEESLLPPESFGCFNDFFIRELKPAARPIEPDPAALIAPADSRVLYFQIDGETVLPIKGRSFTLTELTHDPALAARYRGGSCLIFRLAPADYHRFCYVDDGRHGPTRSIAGHFHSVHPIALGTGLPILPTNYRELTLLETERCGQVVHIDVGALGVGRIVQHRRAGGHCRRGEEKGYFEWGASTIVLLLEPGIAIDADLVSYSRQGIETCVKYGSRIGHV